MRVVSLLPAATEIVAALGGAIGAPSGAHATSGPALVGISHECDFPPEVGVLPRVTRTTLDGTLSSGGIDRALAAARASGTPPITIDVAALEALRPDAIIGQAVCDVCAVGPDALGRAVQALPNTPVVVTLHAHTLEAVFDDIRKVGMALELAPEADELVAGLRYRLHRIQERRSSTTTHYAARTLVLEWLDPPYVAGHWVPELVAIAGGADVGNVPGARSVPRTWPDLSSLAPECVIVALCGLGLARARQEVAGLRDAEAVRLLSRGVEFLDGNAYTSRPGPRLVDAAERLAALIPG
jgi:iron complex transport system substrate-binding protein